MPILVIRALQILNYRDKETRLELTKQDSYGAVHLAHNMHQAKRVVVSLDKRFVKPTSCASQPGRAGTVTEGSQTSVNTFKPV